MTVNTPEPPQQQGGIKSFFKFGGRGNRGGQSDMDRLHGGEDLYTPSESLQGSLKVRLIESAKKLPVVGWIFQSLQGETTPTESVRVRNEGNPSRDTVADSGTQPKNKKAEAASRQAVSKGKRTRSALSDQTFSDPKNKQPRSEESGQVMPGRKARKRAPSIQEVFPQTLPDEETADMDLDMGTTIVHTDSDGDVDMADAGTMLVNTGTSVVHPDQDGSVIMKTSNFGTTVEGSAGDRNPLKAAMAAFNRAENEVVEFDVPNADDKAALIAFTPLNEGDISEATLNDSDTMVSPRLNPGDRVSFGGESYTIQSALGAGNFGVVYKVRNAAGEESAIKILDSSSDEVDVSEVVNEFNIQKALDHPNIAKVYDMARSGDQLIMHMEYVDGEMASNKTPLKGAEFESFATQLLDGLQHAHRRGIFHLDVKPDNVMITKEGQVKIIDFGVSVKRSLDIDGVRSDGINTELFGSGAGSPPYMHTDLVMSGILDATIDRAESYAYGVTCMEMLLGKTGFSEMARRSGLPDGDPEKIRIAPFKFGNPRLLVPEIALFTKELLRESAMPDNYKTLLNRLVNPTDRVTTKLSDLAVDGLFGD